MADSKPSRVQCSVCLHAQREEIDAALMDGRSHTSVATQFGIGRGGVQRHAANHLALPGSKERIKKVTAAAARRLEETVAAVMGTVKKPTVRTPDAVQEYHEELLAVLSRQRMVAESRGDARLTVAIVKEEREILGDAARAMGLFRDGATINVDASTKALNVVLKDMSADQIRETLAALRAGAPVEAALPSLALATGEEG